MAATTANKSSDVTALIQEHYEREALKQRTFENGLLSIPEKRNIPQMQSKVIHWHRWQDFALAETVLEGVEPVSPIAANVDEVIGQLQIISSVINIPKEGDILRIDSLIKNSYKLFERQSERTCNSLLRQYIASGSTVIGGSASFSPATTMYANGKPAFINLTAGDQLRAADIQRAVGYLRQQGCPLDGPADCVLNPWNESDLIAEDTAYQQLIKNVDPKVFKEGQVQYWAGANITREAEPFRESLAGTEGVYDRTGSVITTYVMGPQSVAITQLMGKTGMKPNFKVQDITATGSNMTIGYRFYFSGAVLKPEWIIQLKSVASNATVANPL